MFPPFKLKRIGNRARDSLTRHGLTTISTLDLLFPRPYKGVSENGGGGPNIVPYIVGSLNQGPPNKVPPIFGNPHNNLP